MVRSDKENSEEPAFVAAAALRVTPHNADPTPAPNARNCLRELIPFPLKTSQSIGPNAAIDRPPTMARSDAIDGPFSNRLIEHCFAESERQTPSQSRRTRATRKRMFLSLQVELAIPYHLVPLRKVSLNTIM